MNTKLGFWAAIILTICVILFAVFMVTVNDNFSYFICIILSWAYLILACCYFEKSEEDKKIFALVGVAFAIVYVVIIDIVYFTQLTTISHGLASNDVLNVLSYAILGSWMFNLDLFGYGMLALSTLFISFSIKPENKGDKWLKYLMMVHGVFAISCVIMPMMNVFSSDMAGGDFIGTAVLIFWCAYFAPIGALSARYFKN